MAIAGVGTPNFNQDTVHQQTRKKRTDGADTNFDLMQVIRDKMVEMEEKIKEGDTKPSFQIGGQSFTEEEWDKLIEKVDKDLEEIVEEQEERKDKLEEERKVTEEQIQQLLSDRSEL